MDLPNLLVQSALDPSPAHYRSYLVRLWQSSEQGAWRASAQCVQTGGTVFFGDVESLLAFLQSQAKVRPIDSGESSMPLAPDQA